MEESIGPICYGYMTFVNILGPWTEVICRSWY